MPSGLWAEQASSVNNFAKFACNTGQSWPLHPYIVRVCLQDDQGNVNWGVLLFSLLCIACGAVWLGLLRTWCALGSSCLSCPYKQRQVRFSITEQVTRYYLCYWHAIDQPHVPTCSRSAPLRARVEFELCCKLLTLPLSSRIARFLLTNAQKARLTHVLAEILAVVAKPQLAAMSQQYIFAI